MPILLLASSSDSELAKKHEPMVAIAMVSWGVTPSGMYTTLRLLSGYRFFNRCCLE